MTKMNYLHLKRPNEALKTYRELLGYTKVRFTDQLVIHKLTGLQSNVTRNYAEKSINNILDYVGGEGKVSSGICVGRSELTKTQSMRISHPTSHSILLSPFIRLQSRRVMKRRMRLVYRLQAMFKTLTVPSQRLSTKSNLKLAKLWLDRKEYDRLQPVSWPH